MKSHTAARRFVLRLLLMGACAFFLHLAVSLAYVHDALSHLPQETSDEDSDPVDEDLLWCIAQRFVNWTPPAGCPVHDEVLIEKEVLQCLQHNLIRRQQEKALAHVARIRRESLFGWACDLVEIIGGPEIAAECESVKAVFRKSGLTYLLPTRLDWIDKALRDLFDAPADVARRLILAYHQVWDQTSTAMSQALQDLLGLFRLRGLLPERSLRLPRDVPSDDFPYDESVYDLTRTATDYVKTLRARTTTEQDLTTLQSIELHYAPKISDGSATVEERQLLRGYAAIVRARSAAQAADMAAALLQDAVEQDLADAAFSRARHGADSAYGHALGLLVEAGRGATDTEKKP